MHIYIIPFKWGQVSYSYPLFFSLIFQWVIMRVLQIFQQFFTYGYIINPWYSLIFGYKQIKIFQWFMKFYSLNFVTMGFFSTYSLRKKEWDSSLTLRMTWETLRMTENKSRIIENGTRIIESRLLLIKNNGINKNLPWTFSDFAFQNNNLTCQRTIFYIIKAKFYIFVNYKKPLLLLEFCLHSLKLLQENP